MVFARPVSFARNEADPAAHLIQPERHLCPHRDGPTPTEGPGPPVVLPGPVGIHPDPQVGAPPGTTPNPVRPVPRTAGTRSLDVALKSTQEAVVRRVVHLTIHDQPYLQIDYSPEGEQNVLRARLGTEAAYENVREGDRVLVYTMMSVVTRVEKV